MTKALTRRIEKLAFEIAKYKNIGEGKPMADWEDKEILRCIKRGSPELKQYKTLSELSDELLSAIILKVDKADLHYSTDRRLQDDPPGDP